MKFLSIRLKNYKRIKSGLNLDEIYIDFRKQKHKLCIIVGDNGSGKSALINALTLYPDTKDNFIDNLDAEKEIYVLNQGIIYKALFTSTPNSIGRTTKAYLEKNGVKLNPTGNVNSYKEFMEAELDLDPNTLLLSFLSFNQRGLADMKPGERKKYISNIISSLDAYNNMNKNFSKKASILRSHINSLHTKINSIGNAAELSVTLDSLELRVNALKQKHDALNASISASQAMISSLDPSGEIQHTYQNIYNSVKDVTKVIEESDVIIASLSRKLDINSTEEDAIRIKETSSDMCHKTKAKLEFDKNKLESKQKQLTEDSKLLREKSAKLAAIESDENYEDLIKRKDQLCIEIDKLNNQVVESYPALVKGTTKEEAEAIIEIVKGIISRIAAFYDAYNNHIITDAVARYNASEEQLHKNRIAKEELQSQIDSLGLERTKLIDAQSTINLLKLRPEKCKIEDCEFIKYALELSNKYKDIDESIYSINNELTKLSNQLNEIDKNVEDECLVEEAVKVLRDIRYDISKFSYLLNKATFAVPFIDEWNFFNRINKFHSFEDMYNNFDNCLKIVSIRENRDRLVEVLKETENDILLQQVSHTMSEELKKDIERLQSNVDLMAVETNNLAKSIAHNHTILEAHEKRLSIADALIEQHRKKNTAIQQKEELSKQYQTIKDNIKSIENHIENVNNSSSQLESIDKELVNIEQQRDNYRYSLTVLNEYGIELAAYQDKYNMIDTLKKYSSPNTGIQTLFISMYMQQTKDMVNNLICNFFDGEIRLEDYIINEDEFRIPCNKNGWYIDDISSCSNAQVCILSMCISMALLQQASTTFNIPRWDEIDSGLDYNNSIMFVQMIYRLIMMFNIEQSFLISHSSESVLTDVDIIALKYNSDNPLTGNIIYDYYTEAK